MWFPPLSAPSQGTRTHSHARSSPACRHNLTSYGVGGCENGWGPLAGGR